MTLYGAALGRPVLLGAFGSDSVPGTAAEVLGRHAPRLDPERDARRQVEAAFEPAARAGYAGVAERAFSEPGRALVRLRAVLYELLRLPEPSSGPPPVRALAPVEVPAEPVTSWRVRTRVAARDDGSGALVEVERIPAAVASGPGRSRRPPVCSTTSPARTGSATCGPPRARRSSCAPGPRPPGQPRCAGSTGRWPPGPAASRPRSRSVRAVIWWACGTAGSSRRPRPTPRTARTTRTGPSTRRRSCTRTCAPVSPWRERRPCASTPGPVRTSSCASAPRRDDGARLSGRPPPSPVPCSSIRPPRAQARPQEPGRGAAALLVDAGGAVQPGGCVGAAQAGAFGDVREGDEGLGLVVRGPFRPEGGGGVLQGAHRLLGVAEVVVRDAQGSRGAGRHARVPALRQHPVGVVQGGQGGGVLTGGVLGAAEEVRRDGRAAPRPPGR